MEGWGKSQKPAVITTELLGKEGISNLLKCPRSLLKIRQLLGLVADMSSTECHFLVSHVTKNMTEVFS